MSKMKSIVDAISSKLSVSRRSFIKATLAVGGSAAIIGCEKGSGEPIFIGNGGGLDNVVSPEDLSNAKTYHGGCAHNCGVGARCVSKFHVVNGRVVRVTSDESDYDYEGNLRNREQYNDSRALTCVKARAFKYKLYHPGRLKYTLKQTKARGDVTGFIRIPSQVAMKEVAQKYRSIYDKYGRAAIFEFTGSSTSYYGATFEKPKDAKLALSQFVGGTKEAYSNYSFHQYTYAYKLTGHPSMWASDTSSEFRSVGYQFPAIASVVKNVVSWGSNILSTNNSSAWAYIRAIEKMKERRPESKVYFIGPEFVDTGVTCATDWVQLRNYTDSALIMGMFYEMIINTVDADGKIMSKPWLDLEYLDTMVYGFFDSPAYWVHKTSGVIKLTDPGDAGYTKVDEVPAGKSLSAYVMGSDDRLTKLNYNKSKNYTATQFSTVQVESKDRTRNLSTCSYPSKADSKYYYKQDMNSPKTPEWASVICGTPAETIKELAKMYCDPAQHPIFSDFSGGIQKQDNGVISMFTLASLLCVTKTFGLHGEGMFVGVFGVGVKDSGKIGLKTDYLDGSSAIPTGRPALYTDPKMAATMSVKEWFNGIKIAFHDVLKEKGYTGKHIPEWDGITRYVNDDGATKAALVYNYPTNLGPTGGFPTTFPDNGLDYYEFDGKAANTQKFAGTRMIINDGGGIQLNQHSNTNDSAEMYKCLPISGDATNPDTFCLATFDIYLSPTARHSDYIFASAVSLEAGDWKDIGGEKIYRPPVSKLPGEAKDGWRFAYEAYKAQVELGDFNGVTVANSHLKYVGTNATSKAYQSSDVLSLDIVDKAIASPASRFYGMSRDEVFANQYRPRVNQPEPTITDVSKGAFGAKLRINLDKYLEKTVDLSTTPFIFNDTLNTRIVPPAKRPENQGSNEHADFVENSGGNNAIVVVRDWGSGENNIAEWGDGTRPELSGRFHVYNNTMVWDYERRYSKWHGWLPKEQRGQTNKDYEGDPIIYPIPMYLDFRDSFNESYGVFPIKDASGKVVKPGIPENDLSKYKGLTLSTTHDRYRVHSSHAENPLLRELNHRTKGGDYGSGNDWKEYAVMPERHIEGATAPISPMISSAVYKKDMKTASWHEIWINDQDAADRGIAENDLIVVENPIGAVRVIARLTKRCVRGHINLHQGGWYDPNPIDGIDDGGCANTLMSSKPSRLDNGNSQQFAYVKVRKDTLFV